MHNSVNTGIILSCWSSAARGEAEQKFFSWPLSWCQFCWGWTFLLFCDEKYTGLSSSLPRRWEENWKLTIIVLNPPKLANQPAYPKIQNLSQALPSGVLVPSGRTAANKFLQTAFPFKAGGLQQLRGTEQESKRLLYFQEEKIHLDKH